MITQQDLETLERLYSPVCKILLEHLRADHEYSYSRLDANNLLRNEVNELTEELASLKTDYEALREINKHLLCTRRPFNA